MRAEWLCQQWLAQERGCWHRHESEESGKVYWFNHRSRQSLWDEHRPSILQPPLSREPCTQATCGCPGNFFPVHREHKVWLGLTHLTVTLILTLNRLSES